MNLTTCYIFGHHHLSYNNLRGNIVFETLRVQLIDEQSLQGLWGSLTFVPLLFA